MKNEQVFGGLLLAMVAIGLLAVGCSNGTTSGGTTFGTTTTGKSGTLTISGSPRSLGVVISSYSSIPKDSYDLMYATADVVAVSSDAQSPFTLTGKSTPSFTSSGTFLVIFETSSTYYFKLASFSNGSASFSFSSMTEY